MIRLIDIFIGPIQFAIVIELSPAAAALLFAALGVVLYLWLT